MPGLPTRRPAAMHPNWRATRHDRSGGDSGHVRLCLRILDSATVDHLRREHGDHVRRAALFRRPDLSHQAADARARCATTSGQIIYTGEDIQRGQSVWQSTGGMQQGSIWGHGGYVAPDWSADWLHREAMALRDRCAADCRLSRRWPSPIRRGSAPCSGARCAPTATIRKPTIITVSDQRGRARSRRRRRISRTCSPTARPRTSICASSTRCRRTPC